MALFRPQMNRMEPILSFRNIHIGDHVMLMGNREADLECTDHEYLFEHHAIVTRIWRNTFEIIHLSKPKVKIENRRNIYSCLCSACQRSGIEVSRLDSGYMVNQQEVKVDDFQQMFRYCYEAPEDLELDRERVNMAERYLHNKILRENGFQCSTFAKMCGLLFPEPDLEVTFLRNSARGGIVLSVVGVGVACFASGVAATAGAIFIPFGVLITAGMVIKASQEEGNGTNRIVKGKDIFVGGVKNCGKETGAVLVGLIKTAGGLIIYPISSKTFTDGRELLGKGILNYTSGTLEILEGGFDVIAGTGTFLVGNGN